MIAVPNISVCESFGVFYINLLYFQIATTVHFCSVIYFFLHCGFMDIMYILYCK